jgi:hypothetical protein
MAQTNVVRFPATRTRPPLNIKSDYYLGKDLVKRNSASNPLRAVSRAVEHLRLNSYEATHVEVYDDRRGTLHAVIKRHMAGRTEILYERPLQKTEVM